LPRTAEQATVRIDSVYFDTDQHDLLSHGVTLRCRTDDAARTETRVEPTGSCRCYRSGSATEWRPCMTLTADTRAPLDERVNHSFGRCNAGGPRRRDSAPAG